MNWLSENYMVVVFLVTTVISLITAILKALGKKKAAQGLEEVKKILHQTFGNVEELKKKWKKAGMEERFGHIGEIFAAINEKNKLDDVLKIAYEQRLSSTSKYSGKHG